MVTTLMSVQDLVEHVRTVMTSDTATLLLLDETGSVLEPAASAGLGRRWRGATHVPVGSGFAGRVAAERRPVLLTEVTEHSVLNPILRDFGLHRLLGVPVLDPEGDLCGVLHAGYRAPRDLASDDTRRLQVEAAAIGRRLTERVHDDAHLAALALQRSLLPAAPPAVDGLDVAVRYLPAEGDLGGDWYDIFTLPDGKVAFVLGDVEGHGLRSAVAMGRLRSALRSYALVFEDPAEVVQRLDHKLCYFEEELTATVVYGVAASPFDFMTLCTAGHPAPLLAMPGSELAHSVELEPGVLLGVDPAVDRRSATVQIPPSAALAFYTDGLVERRPSRVDRSGAGTLTAAPVDRLDLVRRVFAAGDDAETACTRIIAEGLGDDSVEDDVALVVVRRDPTAPRSPSCSAGRRQLQPI